MISQVIGVAEVDVVLVAVDVPMADIMEEEGITITTVGGAGVGVCMVAPFRLCFNLNQL